MGKQGKRVKQARRTDRQWKWRSSALAAVLVLVFAAMAAPAAAQANEDARVFVTVNFASYLQVDSFVQNARVVSARTGGVYAATPVGLLSRAAAAEDARFTGSHTPSTQFTFDGGAAVRVGGNFAVGAAVSWGQAEGEASVSARAPHPFFFGRDRQFSGSATGLARSEIGIHGQAQALLPLGDSVNLVLFGGPSVIRLTQDLVADVRFRQQYPFETASFESAVPGDLSGTGIGFNAGADISFYFSERAGVGLLARYSRATVELDTAAGAVDVPAGGLHVGGGFRFRF